MRLSTIYTIAEAGCDSRWYGSAAQAKAENIVSLMIERSWVDDDARCERLSDWIEQEKAELRRLLTARKG